MQILLNQNSVVIAGGQIEETAEAFVAAGSIYLKTSGQMALVEVAELPGGFAPGRYEYVGGEMVRLADPPAAVAAVQTDLLSQINALCDEKMGVIKTGYPESEISTWDQQVREALDYLADPLMVVPLIGNLATSRGLTKTELAGRILTKATAFSTLAGQIIGRRQALEDAINAASTLDALGVVAAQISEGWPL